MFDLADHMALTCFKGTKRSLNESILMEFWVDQSTDQYTQETNWSNPDIRPNKFDGTFDGWLDRIGTWGKLNFIHSDPENRKKGPVSKSQFLDKISTTELLKVYGKFRVELRGVDCMEFIRSYVGLDGKTYDEVFKVKVDLKPQLKKGFHWWDSLVG